MGQKAKAFKSPYIGTDTEEYSLLYTKNGDCSVVMHILNPVLTYSADTKDYYAFHALMDNIIKSLGAGHTVQKQDVFTKRQYKSKACDDFLSQKFQEHFDGREYTQIDTYLVLTRNNNRGMFYQYDRREFEQFKRNIQKIYGQLEAKRMEPNVLSETALKQYTRRMMTLNFTDNAFSLSNIKSSYEHLSLGSEIIKCISLVDVDEMALPELIKPYKDSRETKATLYPIPADLMGFLYHVPEYQTMVYNQVLSLPDQSVQIARLKAKRRKHSNVPDPANEVCINDIDALLKSVANSSQLIVQTHFNVMLKASLHKADKATDFIENALFDLGMITSKNTYNQMELYRASLPGNTGELKDYDKFLTSSDAALCLFFKEKSPKDEQSDFQVYYTDRKGKPIIIDTCDLPVATQRTNNRNFFVLGPSGSGKSFNMNHLVRQYVLNGMDVVMVDTGHSYWGLCAYYQGRYITYTEEHPITMNPFRIDEAEYNEEKREFLVSLLGICWKGAEGYLTGVEHTVLSSVIKQYYHQFFTGKHPDKQQLSFNTFFEYSLVKIKEIMVSEEIEFNITEYRYILKKFYQGGQYAQILNDETDRSLFDEPFIVFEIDAIKDHKILSPITTIIIMDVFIQKMRNKNGRKALVIEEAWKAIASPLMAEYILYLYKTARKFWGIIGIVTQDLEDIINSDIVKNSIISNSGTLFLLDQENLQEDYEQVAKLLSLGEIEQRKIFTINKLANQDGRGRFKEVYIRRGNTGEVYGVENSIYEYLTFTTEKVEKDAVQAYIKQYGSLEDGLECFVKDFNHSRLSLLAFAKKVNQSSHDFQLEVIT